MDGVGKLRGSVSIVALVACALANGSGCGGDDEGGGKRGGTGGAAGDSGGGDVSTTGGSDGGDAAEAGPTLAPVCVKSPTAAAFVGDAACPAPKPSAGDALDEALSKAGVDRCSYGFSDSTMSIWKTIFADDVYQLPIFRPLHTGLLRLPAFARETEGFLDGALDGEHPLSDSILHAALRTGATIDQCAKLDAFGVASVDPQPLAKAVATLIEQNGGSPDLAALTLSTSKLPLDFQKALVPVVAAIDYAAREYSAALGTTNLEDIDWLEQVHGFVIAPTVAFPIDQAHVALLAKVDHARIAGAAALVARAVEGAELPSFANLDVTPVAIETPLGAIVIGSASGDTYEPGHLAESSALFVDTGGDDTYRVPVGSGRRAVPVGVAVDLGGKDRYGYVEVPSALDKPTRPPADEAGRSASLGYAGQTSSRIGRQGSGVLGVGLLWDLGGADDEYHSLALSQGAGAMGVGALFDDGGADRYVAEAASQGAAVFGIGLLLDRAGKDEYRTFFGSQGFGYVRGIGAIADGGGDDIYFADPGDPAIGGDPLYASAQLPGNGNTSMCQGAGYGRRDDAKGLNMGGGAGILYDRAGSDHYTASVFAQGTGYWLGFGMLLDRAGDDFYDGLWYVQGADAHFALALFYDHEGNDTYDKSFPIRATSIGVGHDFSGALHLDLGGNDEYFAPGLSLGCGNSQGIGGFVNLGGTDSYAPAGGNTFGCASMGHDPPFDTVRDVRPTIGIFVDAVGADTYTVPSGGPPAVDEGTWAYPVYAGAAGAPPSEKSGGVDRATGSVSLP